MSHAITRTNATGQPFRGRCIKCGQEDLKMSEALNDCPMDHLLSDGAALLSIIDNATDTQEGEE